MPKQVKTSLHFIKSTYRNITRNNCNWYNILIQKNPLNYKSYQRANKSWFVIDFSSHLEVLPLHEELLEFNIPRNFHNNLEKTLQKNANIGYMHLQYNAFEESSWISLLPGYTIYTSLGGFFFKLSIKKEEESLQFFWQEFSDDFTFNNCNAQGQEKLGFYLMVKKYDIKNISLPSVLGFNEPTIVAILQSTVHKVFPTIFLIKIQLFNLLLHLY